MTLGELVVRIRGDAAPMRQAIGEVKKEAGGLTGALQELKSTLVSAFMQPAVQAAKFGAEAAGAIADVAAKAPALVAGMDAAAQATQEAEQAVQQLAEAERQSAEAAEQAGREAQEAGQKVEEAGRKGATWFGRVRESVTGLVDRVFNLKNALVALATAAGARSLWNWLIGGNAQLEQYQQTLATVLKDQGKAFQMLEWAKQFAASTPFEIPGIVEATVRLEAYGLAAQKWLPLAGDMAAIMGKDVMQAVEAIGDAMTGELERLKEFGIKKADLIAAGLKVNAQGQITDMASMTEALVRIWQDRFIGGMERQSKTFMGMWSNVADFMGSVGRRIGGALFEDRVKPALQNLLAWLDRLQKSGQLDRWAAIASVALTKLWDVVAAGGNVLGTLIGWIAQVVNWLVEHRAIVLAVAAAITTFFLPAIVASGAALGKDLAQAAAGAVKGLIALVAQYAAAGAAAWSAAAGFVSANAPLIAAVAVVAGVVAAIIWLVRNWDQARQAALNFAKSVTDYFRQLWENLRNVTSSMGRAIMAFGKVVLNVFNKEERARAWQEFLDAMGDVKAGVVKTIQDTFAPFAPTADGAATAVVGAMSGMMDKIRALFQSKGINFDEWLKKNGIDPSKFGADVNVNAGGGPLTTDRVSGATAVSDATSQVNEALRRQLDLFDELRARNDVQVNTLQKQAEWLREHILLNDQLKLSALERADIEDRIFQLMLERYEEIAERDNWTAAQRLKNLDAYVGRYARSFDQIRQVDQMRRDLEKQAAEDVAKAQDERFRKALDAYDRETRGLELSAEQRRDIYRRLVVDVIKESERSADTQKAISLALLDFDREIAAERAKLAKQQADLAAELSLREIEATQGKTAALLEQERRQYEERKKLAAGNAALLAQVEADHQRSIAAIHKQAAEEDMQGLLKWTDAFLKANQVEIDGQINAWKTVQRIAAEKGVVLEGLAERIQELEREKADAEVKAAQDAADRIRELHIEELEAQGEAVEAAVERERLALDKALRNQALSEDERARMVALSDQKIARIREEARQKEAEELISWTKEYIGHEIQMGRATEANLLAGLQAVKAILDERGVDTEKLAQEIELLEKRVADQTIEEQRRASEQIQDLLAERLELEGKTTEAAIAREMAAREKALQQEGLTEEARQLIISNSEAKIAQIRQDAIQKEQDAIQKQADELASWAEQYIGHEIEMGRATKENLVAALREVKRINDERGANTEALARKIELLEKEIADQMIEEQQRAADRIRQLHIERLELEGRTTEAAIARIELEREEQLRSAQSEEERAAIVANAELRIAKVREEAQRRAADRVREIQIDLWEAQGRQLEAVIAREELARDQRLRDESLTEDERAQIIQASEARIAKIRQDSEAERQRLNREAAETAAEIEIRILEATGQRGAARLRQLEEEQRREREALQERFKDHADLQRMLAELDRAQQAERAKLLDENAREEAEAQARLLDLRFEMGRISREEYLRGLDEQIQAARQRYGEDAEEYLAAVRKKEEAEKRFAEADAELEQHRYRFLREIGVISLRDHIANLEAQLQSEELTAEQRLALAMELHQAKKQLADEEAAYQERLNRFLVASGQKSVDEQIADLQAKLANLRAQRAQGGITPEQALAIDEQILATQSALNQIVEANHEYRRQLGEISLQQHLEWLRQEYEAEAENTERKKQLRLEIFRTEQELADATMRLKWAELEYEQKLGRKGLADAIKLQEEEVARFKAGTIERIQAEQKLYDLRRQQAEEWLEQVKEQHGGDLLRLREVLQAELVRWEKAGEAGVAYVQVIKRALKDLDNQWRSTWANMLSSVLSGQQPLGDALGNLWRQFVDQQADNLADAIVDGFAQGFGQAKKSGQGFFGSLLSGLVGGVTSGNWFGVILNEVVNLFTAGQQAQEKLAARARARREQDADHERRLQELLNEGFTRSNTHRKETLTEEARYLFGLIKVYHSRTIDVLTEETKQWIERIEGYLSEFRQSATEAIGEALKAGTATSGWRTFLRGLKEDIYEQIVDAVIEAFVQGQLTTRAIAPFIQALDEAMQQATAGGSFDAALFEQLMAPALANLEGQLSQLEGTFQALSEMLQRLRTQLGVPLDSPGAGSGGRSGGTQISEITGPTRDLLVTLLKPLEHLGDWTGFFDAMTQSLQGLLTLAQGDGIMVRLPSLTVAAAGVEQAAGVQWNIDRMDVRIEDGVIASPLDLFQRLARDAGKIAERLKG